MTTPRDDFFESLPPITSDNLPTPFASSPYINPEPRTVGDLEFSLDLDVPAPAQPIAGLQPIQLAPFTESQTSALDQPPWYLAPFEGIGRELQQSLDEIRQGATNFPSGLAGAPGDALDTVQSLVRPLYRGIPQAFEQLGDAALRLPYYARDGATKDIPDYLMNEPDTLIGGLTYAVIEPFAGRGYTPLTAEQRIAGERGTPGVNYPGRLDALLFPVDVVDIAFLGMAGAARRGGRKLITRSPLYGVKLKENADDIVEAFTDATELRGLAVSVPTDEGPRQVQMAVDYANLLKADFDRVYRGIPGHDEAMDQIRAAEMTLNRPPLQYDESYEGLQFLGAMRDMRTAASDIRAAPGWIASTPVVRGLAGAINPSALNTNEAGLALTARRNLIIQSEGLVETALSTLRSRGGTLSGNPPFDRDPDGFIRSIREVSGGEYGIWNDVFANPTDPRWTRMLNIEQLAYIDQYHRLIAESEQFRILNGLPPLGNDLFDDAGALYVPRQVRQAGDVVVTRPSRPDLKRIHDDAQDGFNKGIIYDNDPVATLQLYLRGAYRDAIERQFDEFIAPLGFKPSEIVMRNNPQLVDDLETSRRELATLNERLRRESISREAQKDITSALQYTYVQANYQLNDINRALKDAVTTFSKEQRDRIRPLVTQIDNLSKQAFSDAAQSGADEWRALKVTTTAQFSDAINAAIRTARNDAEFDAHFTDLYRQLREDVSMTLQRDLQRKRMAITDIRTTLRQTLSEVGSNPNLQRQIDQLLTSLEPEDLVDQRGLSQIGDFQRDLKRTLAAGYARTSTQLRQLGRGDTAARDEAQGTVTSGLRDIAQQGRLANHQQAVDVSQQLRNLKRLRSTQQKSFDMTFFDLARRFREGRTETRRAVRTIMGQFTSESAQSLRRTITETTGAAARITPAQARTAFRQQLDSSRAGRMNELLGQIDEKQIEFDELEFRYAAELQGAQNTQFISDRTGELFGEVGGQIPVGTWRGKIYTPEDAAQFNSALGALPQDAPRVNSVLDSVQKGVNVVRLYSTVADFAAPFIQGLPTMLTRPDVWVRAAGKHFQAFLAPQTQARYITENMQVFQEMSRYGIPIGDTEVLTAANPGGTFAFLKFLEKLPNGREYRQSLQGAGRQSIGRFQASFNTYLSVNRAELWKVNRDSWLRNGGELNELAAYIRNMTGGLDSRALGIGPNQRAVENTWVAFSPRFLRSTISLVADATQGAIRAPLGIASMRQKRSARSMATMIGVGMGLYTAFGLGLRKDWEEILDGLNPLNGKRFLSYEFNGDYVGVGGQVRAMIQLAASLTDLSAGQAGRDIGGPGPRSDLGDLNPFPFPESVQSNPLLRFYMSRGAIGTRVGMTFAEGITGNDFDVYNDIDHVGDSFLHLGKGTLPFFAQGLMEGQNWRNTIPEVGGARVVPGTPADDERLAVMDVMGEWLAEGRLTEDQVKVRRTMPAAVRRVVPDEFQKWAEDGTFYSGFKDLRDIDADIRFQMEQDSRVQASQQRRAEKERSSDNRFAQWRQRADALQSEFDTNVQTVFAEFGYGEQFRDRVKELREILYQKRYVGRESLDGEFPDIVEQFSEHDAPINGFNLDLHEYFKEVNDPAFFDNVLGIVDYEARDEAIDRFIARKGQATYDRIRDYLRNHQAPILQELSEDQEVMREYWEVPDSVFETLSERIDDLPDDLELTYREYLNVRRNSPYDEITHLTQRGMSPEDIEVFLNLVQYIDDQRTRFRRDNGSIERLLYKWGYVETFHNPEALSELNGLNELRRVLGRNIGDRSVFESSEVFKAFITPYFAELGIEIPR